MIDWGGGVTSRRRFSAHEALSDKACFTALNAASWSLLSMVIANAAKANAVASIGTACYHSSRVLL
jgi:hypothetical protein